MCSSPQNLVPKSGMPGDDYFTLTGEIQGSNVDRLADRCFAIFLRLSRRISGQYFEVCRMAVSFHIFTNIHSHLHISFDDAVETSSLNNLRTYTRSRCGAQSQGQLFLTISPRVLTLFQTWGHTHSFLSSCGPQGPFTENPR